MQRRNVARMTRTARSLASLPVILIALAGCGGGATLDDAGVTLDAGASEDAPNTPTDANRPADAAAAPDAPLRGDAGPQPGFEVTADRTWQYVEVPGAVCANGSTLGIALNLDPSADRAVVFLQGGGACWDVATCLLLDTAAHLNDTLDERTVLNEARNAGGIILDREDMENPYRDQSYVYVPYCTGDVHVGDTATYYSTPRTMATIEHRGAHNVEIILARLATTLPDLARLTMAGESAGGYGVAVNGFRARLAFPDARVDVLDDSGIIVDADPDQWAQMMESWRPPLPSDCPECLERVTNLLPYYARTMREGERFGLLASREDETIRTYFNFAPAELATAVDAMVVTMNGLPRQRVFVNDGSQHVLLGRPTLATSDGVTVREWVTAFATDDPTWETVGP